MTFNPAEHISRLHKRSCPSNCNRCPEYLEVKWRLVWFRDEHPTDIGIRTNLVEHDSDAGRAIVQAEVVDVETRVVLASGHKMETRSGFPDYLEKAETGAIGRALAVLGYGTQFEPQMSEGERLVDSPVQRSVPTDVREVDDNPDIVRSSDDPDWKAWQPVRKRALELGVKFTDITIAKGGLPRAQLRTTARDVFIQVKQREAQLKEQDASRAAAITGVSA